MTPAWLDDLADALRAGLPVVRITVLAVRGSAPREPGACMLVCDSGDPSRAVRGSIGGGHLEWEALRRARALLVSGEGCALARYTLGASLGQCCGGVVELGLERHDPADLAWVDAARAAGASASVALVSDWDLTRAVPPRRLLRTGARRSGEPAPAPFALARAATSLQVVERLDGARSTVFLYGAGHVGGALVRILAGLPVQVHWVDSREEQFAALPERLPDNVVPLVSELPAAEAARAPAQAWHLIMTHSHDQDFAIGRALLGRGAFAGAGVIGSATKAARFAARWARLGYSREEIGRIICPIGLPGIRGKAPGVIALAVAAQLQLQLEARAAVAAPLSSGQPRMRVPAAALPAPVPVTPDL